MVEFNRRIFDSSLISFFVHDNKFSIWNSRVIFWESQFAWNVWSCPVALWIVQKENLRFIIVLVFFCKQFSFWKINSKIKSCWFGLILYSGNWILTDVDFATSCFFFASVYRLYCLMHCLELCWYLQLQLDISFQVSLLYQQALPH